MGNEAGLAFGLMQRVTLGKLLFGKLREIGGYIDGGLRCAHGYAVERPTHGGTVALIACKSVNLPAEILKPLSRQRGHRAKRIARGPDCMTAAAVFLVDVLAASDRDRNWACSMPCGLAACQSRDACHECEKRMPHRAILIVRDDIANRHFSLATVGRMAFRP